MGGRAVQKCAAMSGWVLASQLASERAAKPLGRQRVCKGLGWAQASGGWRSEVDLMSCTPATPPQVSFDHSLWSPSNGHSYSCEHSCGDGAFIGGGSCHSFQVDLKTVPPVWCVPASMSTQCTKSPLSKFLALPPSHLVADGPAQVAATLPSS